MLVAAWSEHQSGDAEPAGCESDHERKDHSRPTRFSAHNKQILFSLNGPWRSYVTRVDQFPPLARRFYIQSPSGVWTVAQGYGGPTFAWSTTGLVAGTYNVDVWVRENGSAAA